MPKNNNSPSFRIALSAVSCALAVIFLLIGAFSRVLLASGYLMAEISLMIPLSKNFYAGDALAYIGTCILAVLLGAIGQAWLLVPFVMFFGLFNSSIGDASVEIYRVINDYILLFIFIGGTIIFLLYDYVMFRCQRIVNALVYRINR